MRLVSLFFATLPFLAGCDTQQHTCSSGKVMKILHSKLLKGLNHVVGIDNFYDGKRGKLELKNPHYVGHNKDVTLCSVTMRLTHRTKPATNKNLPDKQELPMPYTFKVLDKTTIIVKLNQ